MASNHNLSVCLKTQEMQGCLLPQRHLQNGTLMWYPQSENGAKERHQSQWSLL